MESKARLFSWLSWDDPPNSWLRNATTRRIYILAGLAGAFGTIFPAPVEAWHFSEDGGIAEVFLNLFPP